MTIRTDIGGGQTHLAGSSESYQDNLDLDVLIVGAGFSGVYLLHRLRDELGLKCKIWEAGKGLGGIWHWNIYPGARVDTPVPCYEYSLPSIWKEWTWTEKYPSWEELRQYFEFVDKKLGIKKDVAFETRVISAEFDTTKNKWTVKSEDGRTATCDILIPALGFAAKRFFPDWPGIEKFKGQIHHTSFWPQEGVDVRGKKVAVIGTGATGIQCSQEIGKTAGNMTVFQRTPNLALPMGQKKLTKEEQDKEKPNYPQYYIDRMKTFAGFPYTFVEKKTFDDSPEEREAFFQKLWDNAGFEFWLATYSDMLFEWESNDQAYKFWNKKTRARVTDPRKRDIVAPEKAPHTFGTKRPSLEQNWYEIIDKPNNDVVDITATPVKEVTEKGIVTSDGVEREFDIIALATGFDSVTGGMKNMGLKNISGGTVEDHWKEGTYTHMGMCMSGFPNMFFLYGAHGPTAFSNGPSCVELQGEWIFDAIAKMKKDGVKYIEAQPEAEKKWHDLVKEINDKTLFPFTKSWYMGANVPGKIVEQLNFPGGFPLYYEETRKVLDNNFEGFTVKT